MSLYVKDKQKLKQKLHDRQRGLCPVCNLPILKLTGNSVQSGTIEHIKPRSEGGSNGSYNLELLHRNCNFFRNYKRLAELKKLSPEIAETKATEVKKRFMQSIKDKITTTSRH